MAAAEEAARVSQRCEEAKSSGELLLDHCGLRKFPDAVFFLLKGVELSKVDLSHNQLQKIPTKFGSKFSSITILDLSHNSLATLPDEFSHLEKLEKINVSHNNILHFPEMLQQLPALNSINLSFNSISDVHVGNFMSAQSLEELNLSENPLNSEVIQLLESIIRVKIIL